MSREPSEILTDVVENLSLVEDLSGITSVVATAARELTGAAGATFILKDGDQCHYADENAISPLWKGRRFPLEACISGWSMIHRTVVVIPDIYEDPRIPHDAYRPTFVKSLCMVPVRSEKPMAAIGSYWPDGQIPSDDAIKHLQILANSSAIALENLALRDGLRTRGCQLAEAVNRERELEMGIHSLAHDLRNPLSAMMLFAEVLKSKMSASADPKLFGYCDSILKTGERANSQIRRMLSLYGAAHRDLQPTSVNLSEMAKDLIEQQRAGVPSRRVDFEIESDLVVRADPVLIEIALENLISNAFKYSSKKSETVIRFRRQSLHGGAATFFVSDNGAGFEASEAERLFRPLARLHDQSEFPGVGLGLASVARIIELHGGKIWAEGKKSEGATFYFDLPVAG